MDYSVAGLVGGAVALVAGLVGYFAIIPPLQQWLISNAPRDTQAQREDLEFKLGVMRRLILSVGFVVFAWGGYWIGRTVAG
ncbi:MAG TPA: hypothetical protein VJT13_07500 [Xanthobacteraceae bacterium]|nr:hypothetical protein [Xanthobacteraceae bacterium]